VIALPPDPGLPGFIAAFDTGAAAAAIAATFPELEPISHCTVERFRYKRGTRAVFQYKVSTGDTWQWVTVSQLPDGKMRKVARDHVESGKVRRVPGLHGVASQFPYDRKLPQLEALLDKTNPVLHNALGDVAGDDAELVSADCQAVRYRPHISCMLRAQLSVLVADEVRTSRTYVKLYTDEDVSSVGQRLQVLTSQDSHGVLRPTAVLPEHAAIIWPEVQGRSLTEAIVLGESDPNVAVTARALRNFHTTLADLPVISPRQEALNSATRHGELLTSLLPSYARLISDIVSVVPGAFPNEPVAPFHHDMKPEHALIKDGFVTFIDVEGIAIGDPALDIGNMIARIEALAWIEGIDAARCREAAETFCSHSLPCDDRKIAAATALGKLKLATYAVTHVVDEWPRIVAHELEGAARQLQTVRVST
jgi:hypothetical protein